MSILVTGAAGFIGYHLCQRLLKEGNLVIGIDNMNNIMTSLKKARLKELFKTSNSYNSKFNFYEKSLEDFISLDKIFQKFNPQRVVNLAAQAGVRYSIENPSAYINSNVVGFGNILELCRIYKIKKFSYASSSSAYGGNINFPL